MKSNLEQKSDTQVVIHVEIDSKTIDLKLKELFKEVSRTIEVPGFRRGKVPRRFMEDRFGQDFLYEDAQSQLLEEYIPKALEEHEVLAASRPKPEVVDFSESDGFKFDIEIDIFPPIDLPEDLAVEVDAPEKLEIKDDMVNEAVENLRADHATLVPREDEESSEEEDVIVIKDENDRTQELQARAEGWMEELIGVKVGESVDLKPSDDETIPVTIEAIKRIELPDVDEMAESLGHDDEAALKAEIRKNLEERADNDYEQAVKLSVLDKLVEESSVVIPSGIIDELMTQDTEILQRSGRELTDEEKESMRESLEQRLKRDRTLEAVRERESLTYTDEEFDAFIEEEAAKRDQNVVKFKALLEREQQLERIRRDQETQVVLSHLMEKATIK